MNTREQAKLRSVGWLHKQGWTDDDIATVLPDPDWVDPDGRPLWLLATIKVAPMPATLGARVAEKRRRRAARQRARAAEQAARDHKRARREPTMDDLDRMLQEAKQEQRVLAHPCPPEGRSQR